MDTPDGPVRKGRIVVDIRNLNDMSLRDAYLVRSQDNIFAYVQGAKCISIMDAMRFYWQWLVSPESRWCLNIVTPFRQYTSNCAIFGYKN